MRFSLRTMMSGALQLIRRLRRLLRLMTRRYRSLRSEVVKRPPSSGTSGPQFRWDHRHNLQDHPFRARLPESIKASMTLRRLTNFFPAFRRHWFRRFRCEVRRAAFPGRSRDQQLADSFSTDLGGEAVIAVFVLSLVELVLRQDWRSLSGVRPGSMTN